MGVRVRVRIGFGGKSVEAVALLNTGFEGDVPEILVPLDTAERLGVWPALPEGALVETYRSASGFMRVYRIRGANVRLVTEDAVTEAVDCYLVVSL